MCDYAASQPSALKAHKKSKHEEKCILIEITEATLVLLRNSLFNENYYEDKLRIYQNLLWIKIETI